MKNIFSKSRKIIKWRKVIQMSFVFWVIFFSVGCQDKNKAPKIDFEQNPVSISFQELSVSGKVKKKIASFSDEDGSVVKAEFLPTTYGTIDLSGVVTLTKVGINTLQQGTKIQATIKITDNASAVTEKPIDIQRTEQAIYFQLVIKEQSQLVDTILENTAVGTEVGQVLVDGIMLNGVKVSNYQYQLEIKGQQADYFLIDEHGIITLKISPNYEEIQSLNIKIYASIRNANAEEIVNLPIALHSNSIEVINVPLENENSIGFVIENAEGVTDPDYLYVTGKYENYTHHTGVESSTLLAHIASFYPDRLSIVTTQNGDSIALDGATIDPLHLSKIFRGGTELLKRKGINNPKLMMNNQEPLTSPTALPTLAKIIVDGNVASPEAPGSLGLEVYRNDYQ